MGRVGLSTTPSATWYRLLLAVSAASKPQSLENGEEGIHVAPTRANMPKTPWLELMKRKEAIQASIEITILGSL